MTESTRIGLAKAAVTALAILYAVAALAALATSTTNGGRSTADRIERLRLESPRALTPAAKRRRSRISRPSPPSDAYEGARPSGERPGGLISITALKTKTASGP